MSAGTGGRRDAREALLPVLGCLGALPDIFLGSLSSGFIDQVLLAGDRGRVLPILCSYLALSAGALWLDWGYLRLLEDVRGAPGSGGGAPPIGSVRAFTIFVNAALVMLLHPLALLPCGALLGYALPWRRHGRGLSAEGSRALQVVLQAAELLISGNLVMRGGITMGRLYAIQLFSGTVFSNLLTGLIRPAPPPPREQGPSLPAAARLWRTLRRRRGLLLCALLLWVMNMICESAFLALQRLSLRSCIPFADWDGLVRNCLLLCAAALASLPVRRGGVQSLRQLFHGCVPARIEDRLDRFARWLAAALLGVCYAAQLPRYNRLLAGQATAVCLAALGACLLSAAARGGLTERRCDAAFRRLQNFLTAYLYFALALGVTEMEAGDLVLFMTALRGLCQGVRDGSKAALWIAGEPRPGRREPQEN